ncbi:10050_t:CDS:2 [Ambispora leptoticha]|uniref:10050_t:CDS:1 n=1 Tax=Ambispora leptoticha TaxID=144679 RepID=A0A9N9HC33_9GLOM|nr:10050_t:CDS:2 [Ambispora leptoticha]
MPLHWFETFLECAIAALGRMIQDGRTPSECWEMQMDPSKEKKFWTDVTTDLQHALETSTPTMESLPKQLYAISDAPTPKFMLIIRRAYKNIGWKNFMCFMLDAAGSLSNFAPTETRDPSLRRPTAKPLKLLPPFIDVSTMDALFTRQVENPTDKFLLVRALWAALLKSGLSIERAVETTEIKLLGGTTTKAVYEQLAMAIAIMSVLVSVDISLITSDSDATLVKVLQLFGASFQCGFVGAGHLGELVARLILIIAWRKCIQKSRDKDGLYTRELSLKEFLSALFGDLDALVTTNDSWKGQTITGIRSMLYR